jgi:hypothetical protein
MKNIYQTQQIVFLNLSVIATKSGNDYSHIFQDLFKLKTIKLKCLYEMKNSILTNRLIFHQI